MQEVSDLVKSAMHEIERLLDSKTVVGEPMTINETTIVPLVSVGFAFGSGGGSGKGEGGAPKRGASSGRIGGGECSCGGVGGGGGIKPVGVLIIDRDGNARLEAVAGRASTVIEKLGDVVGKVVETQTGKKALSESSESD